MRFARLTTNGARYLRRFYATRPDLASRDYDAQHATLMADGYGWADFWSEALRPLGYEGTDLIANAEPMQKQWAREHGLVTGPDWIYEVAAAQLKSFAPEVLFVTDYTTFGPAFLSHLRDQLSSLRLIMGWCGAPCTDETVLKVYDVVLSCIPEYVTTFRAQGGRAEHIHHGFPRRILGDIDGVRSRTAHILFTGSLVKREGFHLGREQLIVALLHRLPLDLYLDAENPPRSEVGLSYVRPVLWHGVQALTSLGLPKSLVSRLPLVGRAVSWNRPPTRLRRLDRRLWSRSHPPIYGLEMFQRMADSSVVLNVHLDDSVASASNMRLFEATGVGSCLLTDWKANLRELFDPEEEVMTYRSTEECIEKALFLLDNPKRSEEIAAAGQRRTLRDHTFDQRAQQLDEIISRMLSRPR